MVVRGRFGDHLHVRCAERRHDYAGNTNLSRCLHRRNPQWCTDDHGGRDLDNSVCRPGAERGLSINTLFAGESGTGKTMAAEVIANDLRLNLYRIDLSALVSKYIGATEKNLRRLFDAAEDGGALPSVCADTMQLQAGSTPPQIAAQIA